MADELELTSDPICTVGELRRLISEVREPEANALINDLSDLFKRYTNRVQITSASVEEWVHGSGTERLWVHASPVDETETFTIEVYSGGEVASTYTLAGGDFRLVQSAVDAYIVLDSTTFPVSTDAANIKLSYTGGWAAGTIPGSVFMGAVMQARIERQRLEGLLGVEQVSRQGETVKYETSSIIKAVRDKWEPYRIEV